MARRGGQQPPNQVLSLHKLHVCIAATVIFAVFPARTEDFRPPAQNRYAQITVSGTILPGGRILKPYGTEIQTGPGPFGLAVSPKGIVATADIGFDRFGITVVEAFENKTLRSQETAARHIWARTPNSHVPEIADPDWKGVSAGIAFDSDKSLWISEGASGRLRQIDLSTGDHKKIVNLNTAGLQNSFIGEVVYSPAHRLLAALDRANSRIVVLDARGWRIVSTLAVSPKPVALALSPDGNTAYVAVERGVCFIDIHDPAKPKITGSVPAPSPEALLATDERVFASNALDDSITVISAGDMKATGEIHLSIPSLERFKGIVPAGMAYDPVENWLLVAESGINAVGVIDIRKNEAVGHLPAGWMPTRVAVSGDRVFVANAGGRGTGPSPRRAILILGEPPVVHPGSLSTFILPDREEILRQTGYLFSYDGFVPYMRDPAKMPPQIEHVVVIVKGSETFDEILGDAGANAVAFPGLARFGMHGRASGGKTQFSVQDAPITPNQHAIALGWAFSDNFYTDGDTASEAEIFLDSRLPDLATEIMMRGGADTTAKEESDQSRADRFIQKINSEGLGPLTVVSLPNDRPHDPDAQAGFPYEASYYEDNDLATGRILAAISHSQWWKNTVVFITEHDTEGGLDHLNSRRTLLLAAGPYVRKHYVSHLNSDVVGLWRTIAEILGSGPHNLREATGASLRDLFTAAPDFAPYEAVDPDRRIFDRQR